MTKKKERVKEVVRTLKGVWTIDRLMHLINHGVSTYELETPVFEVSKSTIYRALREMDTANEIDLYFNHGHCYDELKFRKLK